MIDSSLSFTHQDHKERHLQDGETLCRLLEYPKQYVLVGVKLLAGAQNFKGYG